MKAENRDKPGMRGLELIPACDEQRKDEILFVDQAGRELRPEDLEFRPEPVLPPGDVPLEARRLWNKGRSFGNQGRLPQATEAFLQATLIVLNWPQLYFDLALTYLYQHKNRKSLVCFRKVDALLPRGFLSTKSAIDTLQKEENRIMTPGTYLSYLSLDEEEDPDRKRQLAFKILKSSPLFAPAWMELVLLSASKHEQMHFIQRGLACSGDPDTHGFFHIQKAIIMYSSNHREEALNILSTVIHAPDCTQHNDKKARMLLKGWLL